MLLGIEIPSGWWRRSRACGGACRGERGAGCWRMAGHEGRRVSGAFGLDCPKWPRPTRSHLCGVRAGKLYFTGALDDWRMSRGVPCHEIARDAPTSRGMPTN